MNSPFYAQLKQKYALGTTVIDIPCPTWVGMVESGSIDENEIRTAVRSAVELGADQIVLGCTHYPFLSETIGQESVQAEIIHSGPAIARQVQRILTANEALADEPDGTVTYLTSGNPERVSGVASALLERPVRFRRVGN